jgi:serine/threonine protein kinase
MGREELRQELARLGRQGWAGRQAASLFTALLLEGTPPPLDLPGQAADWPGEARWGLPRCLRGWEQLETRPGEYLRWLFEDLTGASPVAFLLGLAADGHLDFAEPLLRLAPVANPAGVQLQLDECRSKWQELVALEREELRRRAEPLGAPAALAALESELDQAVRTGAFDIALVRQDELRREIDARLEALHPPPGRDELQQQIHQLHQRVLQAVTDKRRGRQLRQRLDELDEELDAADLPPAARRGLQQQLAQLAAELGLPPATSRPTPSTGTAPPQAPAPVAADAPAPRAAAPAPEPAADDRLGVVKVLLGKTFGFAIDLGPAGASPGEVPPGEVFLHRNVLRGDPGPLGTDLVQAPGQFVIFEKGLATPDNARTPAKWWRPCMPPEEALAAARLEDRFGACPADVGILGGDPSQRLVLTLGHGAWEVQAGGLPLPRGALVRFEVLDEARRQVKLLGAPEPGSVAPRRQQLLEQMVPRPGGAAPLPARGQALTGVVLLQLRAGSPAAMGWVRQLHTEVRRTRDPRAAFEVVNLLNERSHPDAPWWQAMLVYAFLLAASEGADEDSARPGGLLDELARDHARWGGSSFDACASWVYQALLEFVADYPGALSLEEVLDFFQQLQQARGANPHFRIEVLQARLRQQLHGVHGAADHLHRALAHVNRALILNPRLAEALDLRDRLQREAGRTSAWAVPSAPGSDGEPDPGAVAVASVERVKAFYQRDTAGPDGPRKAEAYFKAARAKEQGLVLDQLVLEHARFLHQRGRHLEAEQTVLDHLLQYTPAQGVRPFLRLLHEAWTSLRMRYGQAAETLQRLAPRVPAEEQYYVSLLKARLAYREGDYQTALTHAQESNESAPSADAQRLIRRAEVMLDRVPEASLSAPERREKALDLVRRSSYTDEGRGPMLLVLDAMTDPEVGPWLILQAVSGEAGIELSRDDQKALVDQAQDICQQPSLDLFRADLMVNWGQEAGYGREGGLEVNLGHDLMEEVLQRPDAMLKNLDPLLRPRPWCGLALFDCLSRQYPDDLRLRWRRGLYARLVQRKEDYVESALACIDKAEVPEATFAQVASDLVGLELYGLALGMAVKAGEHSRTLPLAEEKGRLAPWEWPARLHEAKAKHAAGEWVEAADRAVRVLVTAPEHWPACRAFSEIFSRPFEEDAQRAARVLDLAKAVVTHLQRQRPLAAELLVLRAELQHHSEGLGGNRILSARVVHELTELCRQAQQARPSFAPAAEMQKHLHNRELEVAHYARGEIFFNYRIVDQLGGGAFGWVYKAQTIDPVPDRPAEVTLKFVRADAPTPEKEQERRRALEREARIARLLDHEHIVKTYDFLDERCLVMEFIDGQTLAQRMEEVQRRRSWPAEAQMRVGWTEVARIGRQIAQALQHAGEVAREELGSDGARPGDFAHRDIHPGNIMVVDTPDGPHAKLLDFGLARLPGGSVTSVDFTNIRRMHYRDPQYGHKTDFRGDMFSLGVILYELLSGDGPYPVDRYCEYLNRAGDVTAPQVAALRRPVGRLVPAGTELPAGLEDILLRMVAFRPAERYPSWEALVDALTRLLTREGLPSTA